VGRTGFCIHPRETLKRIPKVGGTKSVKLEKVRALAPTHVIVNVDENTRETANALAAFVPKLIVTHPLGPLDNLALYRQVGGAFGKEREAEALCSRFELAFREAEKRKFPRREVLYLIWKDPWMTVSRDTYISRMLALFGLETLPPGPAALPGDYFGRILAERCRSGPAFERTLSLQEFPLGGNSGQDRQARASHRR